MPLCCLKGCKTTRTFHTTRVLAFFCFKWQRQRTTICWCRKTSKGIAATRPGRRLRHFNSRSFFRQNLPRLSRNGSNQLLKCSSASDDNIAGGTPSPFWSVKSILNHCVLSSETEKFCWGQPESRESSSETENLFRLVSFWEHRRPVHLLLSSSMGVWFFCISSSETEKFFRLVSFEADDTVYWHRIFPLLLSPEAENTVIWDRKLRIKTLRINMLPKDNSLNMLFKNLKTITRKEASRFLVVVFL